MSTIVEFLRFLRANRKWWLIPILLMVGLFAVLILLTEVAPVVTPFIYTLF